jgi:2-oxoglutarate dehydrogenase E1 component
MCGLVMLLPHGYEGQGPEHSSGRPERFLDMAAENNMVIANCTTPANFFHLIRRQMKWSFRKPLIVFTPKSLLRHPLAVSTIEELTDNRFRELITDNFADPKKVKRVLFCSGKVYYDLLERQQKDERKDVAIIRVEQLYPMPEKQIIEVSNLYPDAEYFWVQEEPKNMGAWTYWLRREEHMTKFRLISRKASASPATGYSKVHTAQQQAIVDEAFAI